MIFITGDKHGDLVFVKDFCDNNKNLSKEDVLIILGDVGINFDLDRREKKVKKMLSKLPLTILCVHGNHEERPYNIKGYREVDCFDGKVYQERKYPNVLFCKDGENYKIEDRYFFALGGAYSTDKYLRLKEGWKWFPSEQPSPDSRINAKEKIKEYNSCFDIVISHTCPKKFIDNGQLRHSYIDQYEIDYSTEEWLEEIDNTIQYNHWYFGHFHKDMDINDKATVVFNSIIKLQ